jgi:hypothetical protein
MSPHPLIIAGFPATIESDRPPHAVRTERLAFVLDLFFNAPHEDPRRLAPVCDRVRAHTGAQAGAGTPPRTSVRTSAISSPTTWFTDCSSTAAHGDCRRICRKLQAGDFRRRLLTRHEPLGRCSSARIRKLSTCPNAQHRLTHSRPLQSCSTSGRHSRANNASPSRHGSA